LRTLAISLGAVAGANARYWVGVLFIRLLPWSFPYGTLFINVSGSLLLGAFFAYVNVRYPGASAARLLVATGFCGAYTTFSTFSYEVLGLTRDGAWGLALLYIGASLALGLGGVAAGYALGGALTKL